MHEILIKTGSGQSRVLIGACLKRLEEIMPDAKKVMVIDAEVRRLYEDSLPRWPALAIQGGEECKELSNVEKLYKEFLRLGLDRHSLVVAIGGGTVCDLTGFAAATYMRGVRCAMVPTTLLAQVDAGIGGKNGVNLAGFKNIIGTIRQPEVVICDPVFLQTLPPQELRSGLAEIIKAGLISHEKLFDFLERSCQEVLSLEESAINEALAGALDVKAKIVEEDEREQGVRIKLNFGHTLGHAVELAEQLPHGYAVSVGMLADARLSEKLSGFDTAGTERLKQLLLKCGLPTTSKVSRQTLIEGLYKDKKRRDQAISIALLKRIGHSELLSVPLNELEGLLDDLR